MKKSVLLLYRKKMFFMCYLLCIAVASFYGCGESSETGYPENRDLIALTTLQGKSRATRYVFSDNLAYLETAVLSSNATEDQLKEDDTRKNGLYRITSGHFIEVGSRYRSGSISSDRKISVLATVDDNEESETSISVVFQKLSRMVNASVAGEYHLNTLSWDGSGFSFVMSKSAVSFDGKDYVTLGNLNYYYKVSDDGTIRVGSGQNIMGMLGKNTDLFFWNKKDDDDRSVDFNIGIKKSSGKTTQFLKGKFLACELGKNPEKIFAQRIYYEFDGNGSYKTTSADNKDLPASGGVYSVADDGSLFLDDTASGAVSPDGSFMTVMIKKAGDWRFVTGQKI